jgi:hypothetical protein
MKHLPIALLLTLLCHHAGGFAQTPDATFRFIPTDNCKRCHEVPGERDAASGVAARVRMSEWKIWQEQDKHASAFRVLSEPRSQRMGQLLGKNVLAPAAGCIQCHTSNAVNELWSPECVLGGENVCAAEGVSCQTCHGPAQRWESEHYKPEWRALTADEKAKFGFNSLENPISRANMCTSCHIGSAELGRVITHEMYAAGHPLLSGFDMESFADKMPRHWRYSHEKPGAPPFNFERTRAVLIGSVVALRASVDLAAASKANWPELARLECYSCHHELHTPSWRQDVLTNRNPGRPRLELGCLPLVRVAMQVAKGPQGMTELDALLARTREPFANNLFGDPLEIAELPTTLDTWAVEITQNLTTMPLDEAKVRQILELLLNAAAEGTPDFDNARQLTGALYIVGEELARSGAQVPGLENLLTRLKALEDDERGFALISTSDKRVEDKFHLQLANRARFKPEVYSQLLKSLREQIRTKPLINADER